MENKPTYEELELKIRKLEKQIVSYSQAKESIRKSLEKHDRVAGINSEPEMALEVLDQENTDKQPVEQALIAEHIFRRTIEESIPSGIAAVDRQGRQIYVNRGFCEMIGWSEEELIESQYPYKYWPAEVFDLPPQNIQILIRDNNASEGTEMPFVRKNGEKFWGLVTSAELKDGDGHTIGYLMSVADISAQKRAENSMRDLSSRLVNAQESERKFVSQELHDGVGGKLTAIKYSLEKLISELDPDSSSLRSSLIDVLAIVHDTIGETQRIYRNLHPSILDDLGLHAALRSLCREFREIYKDIKVECHFNLSEQRIPECLKILIFRILQEALNNVAKHSQADNVYVALDQKADTVGLMVQDDGMGFDKNMVLTENIQTRGLGLRSIEGRTSIFGGSLEIQSEPGEGTAIRASWPL